MLQITDIMFLLFILVSLYIFILHLLISLGNKKDRFTKMAKLPLVSIIIPAYNEEDTIEGTLKAVQKLNYPKKLLEVIVVDDGSTDDTARIAKKFKGVKVLSKKNGGKAHSLNFGTKIAKGEIIASVDSDSYPTPSSLMKSMQFFEDPMVAAVTSSIFVRKPKNMIEHLQWFEYVMLSWIRRVYALIDSLSALPGPLSLYRKDVLVKVGGFDENIMTEDIEIAWRLLTNGYKTKVSLDSKVYTRPPNSLKDWWKQRIRWNIGGIQSTVKYSHTFFSEEHTTVGSFLVPIFYLSYLVEWFGILLFSYVISHKLYNFLSYNISAILMGINPFKHFSYSFLPNVLSVFGVMLVIFSLLWMKVCMDGTEKKPKLKVKNIVNFIVFLSIYAILFPINMMHSFYKFFTKKYEW